MNTRLIVVVITILFLSIVSGCEKNPIEPVPSNFFINQNYPNPFWRSTTIVFGIPLSGHGSSLRLVVRDVQRSLVTTLMSESDAVARQDTVTWSGQNASGYNMPSGLYLIELQGNSIFVSDKDDEVYARIIALKR